MRLVDWARYLDGVFRIARTPAEFETRISFGVKQSTLRRLLSASRQDSACALSIGALAEELKGARSPAKKSHCVEALLTENDVVNAVQATLKQRGWTIRSFATTMQHGVDVVATLDKHTLYVEAKGITSSKDGSSRFGKIQTGSQMYISVAAALLKTAEMRHANPDSGIAIALPKHPAMVKRIGGISTVLEAARIGVLWVGEDLSVCAWNAPWFKRT